MEFEACRHGAVISAQSLDPPLRILLCAHDPYEPQSSLLARVPRDSLKQIAVDWQRESGANTACDEDYAVVVFQEVGEVGCAAVGTLYEEVHWLALEGECEVREEFGGAG